MPAFHAPTYLSLSLSEDYVCALHEITGDIHDIVQRYFSVFFSSARAVRGYFFRLEPVFIFGNSSAAKRVEKSTALAIFFRTALSYLELTGVFEVAASPAGFRTKFDAGNLIFGSVRISLQFHFSFPATTAAADHCTAVPRFLVFDPVSSS